MKLLPRDPAQTVRFALHPSFDRWAAKHIQPGDHVYSSYGYANRCFEKTKSLGGTTFIDGGNSHPAYFWELLCEEHAKWGVKEKPVPEFHIKRSIDMVRFADFVFAPSAFVARSFIERGFKESQILRTFYPVDLSHFKPELKQRETGQPFTIINTGSLSLRKGTLYLLRRSASFTRRFPIPGFY